MMSLNIQAEEGIIIFCVVESSPATDVGAAVEWRSVCVSLSLSSHIALACSISMEHIPTPPKVFV